MSEEELTAIFGDLDAYIPLHEGQHKFPLASFVCIWSNVSISY